jgi:ssDNA-specific exonuclease RecJ
MKLFDVYKSKNDDEIIQIESYATHMNTLKDSIIVFSRIERHNEIEIGSCPSFNGYGTREEIEKYYELLVKQEDLDKYEDWNDIFKLINKEEV